MLITCVDVDTCVNVDTGVDVDTGGDVDKGVDIATGVDGGTDVDVDTGVDVDKGFDVNKILLLKAFCVFPFMIHSLLCVFNNSISSSCEWSLMLFYSKLIL